MSDVHARRLLVFLVLAAVALTAVIVMPFWKALLVAAVVSAAVRRPMEWLSRRLRGRRQIAAALLTVGVLLVVIVPVATLGAVVVNQIIEGAQWLRQTVESEGVRGVIERLPSPIQRAGDQVLRAIPSQLSELKRLAGAQGGQAAAAVGGVLAATGTALFQSVMMLIALFFFLTDGHRLVGWIDARLPLRSGQFRALIEDFRQTSVSVLAATLGTAAIQTAAATIGYLIARAPNVLFLTLVTFIIALIPAVGAAAAVVVVALLLLLTGHTIAAIFLALWGVVVVGLSDNVARPYLLKGEMELHGGLIFFALIGGLAVFGGIGLVLGPLVLTFLVATTRLYNREFRAEPTPPPGE